MVAPLHTERVDMTDLAPRTYRIGQIVPSSNVTMETEIPAMLRRREDVRPDRFTFHSSRMRMREVSAAELAAMDAESDRCAIELSDARVDVMGYACLVAIMAQGAHYHCVSQDRLSAVARAQGADIPVVTSAGALIDGLRVLRARRISLIAPYLRPLTDKVVAYIEGEGIQVQDSLALEIPDNLAVAARNPLDLVPLVERLDHDGVDAVVLSACVQMPSLAAIEIVQDKIGKPVLSAAVATTYQLLDRLGLDPFVPGAGALLAGVLGQRQDGSLMTDAL